MVFGDHSGRQRQLPQEVYLWIQSLDLSYSIRSVKRDFSNGFLVAEAFSRYFPTMISVHGYQNGNSLSCKSANWHQLQRIFKRIQFEVDQQLLAEIIHCKNGAVCSFLEDAYEFLSGRTIKRQVASSAGSNDKTPSFARDTASRVIHNYLKEPSVQAITDLKIRAKKTEKMLQEHKSKIDASRSLRSKSSGSSIMSQDNDQMMPAPQRSFANSTNHLVAAESNRDNAVIVKNVTVRQITTNITQVRASKEMSSSLYSVKSGSPSQSESKNYHHHDEAGPPQVRVAMLINGAILTNIKNSELTDGDGEPMFKLVALLEAQSQSPETLILEEALTKALEEINAGFASSGLGPHPDAVWIASTFFLQMLEVLPSDGMAYKACEEAWVTSANVAREVSAEGSLDVLMNVVWPKLVRLLASKRCNAKHESLLRVVYAYTPVEHHLMVIKALHDALPQDSFIVLLSLLAPIENFECEDKSHALDLYLYYSFVGMESAVTATQCAAMSILLELAKQYPEVAAEGMELAAKLRRRVGTQQRIKEQVLILACVLLQSGLEGNCDVVREIMKTAATQAEREMALLHVGQIVTKYGTLASPFFKLLFKLFSRCRDSGEQALFAHDQHNLFRSWDHAFVAKRVTKAMEASPERWHLELFFCCVRGAADLNVPEWEALFHDSKQYLFHSLTLEHLQQPAVAGIVYWTRRAEYSKAMLTDPLLTHTLMSVFEVGATTDDKAAHPGVYAFFEQLLTNETAQFEKEVCITACDVLRSFIEAHAGHLQVHSTLADLEELVDSFQPEVAR